MLFNFYVLFLSTFIIVDSIAEGIILLMSKNCEAHPLCDDSWKKWIVIAAFGISIVFGLFTISMVY